eukprot:scaffold69686_cov12-Tisochrysis_lutea.AAC.1
MDREFSSDIGLVIGDTGEKMKTRSATEMSSWREGCGKQGGDAAGARERLEKQAGQGGRFEGMLAEAKSVPYANFARTSNLPCRKNLPLRGSSSFRNLRQDYLHMWVLG